MENDVSKNKIAPWQEKGRWYHGTITLTNGVISFINEQTDKYILDNFTIYQGFIHPNDDNVHIIDGKRIFRITGTILSIGTTVIDWYFLADNTYGYNICPYGYNANGSSEFWLFVVKDNV